MKKGRDFLDIDRVDVADLQRILALGHRLKLAHAGLPAYNGQSKGFALLILKSLPTRTRVSFEVGMRQLGGDVTTLSRPRFGGPRRTIADTGRVLSLR